MPENKLQALYANLSKLNPGFKVPLEQFETDMQDEGKLQTLHTNLAKQHDDFKVPYDQFKSDMWSTIPSNQPIDAIPAAQAVPGNAVAAPSAVATPVATPQLSFQAKGLELPGTMDKVLPTEKTSTEQYFKPAIEQADVTQVKPDPKLGAIDSLKAEYLGKTRGQDYATKWAEEAAKTGSFATEAGARLQRAGTEFNQMLVNAPNTLLRMVNAPFNEVAKAVGLPQVDGESFNKMTGLDKTSASLDEVKETLSNKILKLNPKAEESLTESLGKGDFGTFGRNLAGQVLEALPLSISLMAATPAVGATAVTAAGAVLFGGAKMKELDEKAPGLPEGIKAMVGASNGALEGWFESVFGSGAVAGAMTKLVANEGKTAAKEVMKGGLREGVIALLSKYPALAPMGEFYEEFMTQTSQNYVDILAGLKPNTKLFEGSLDAGLVGLASGGLHTAPLSVIKSYQYNKAKQAFSDNREQAEKTVQQNFEALRQPDGNLHTGFDKEGNEVIITSTTPGGMAVLQDGRIVDVRDLQDVQAHPFETLFAQQIAEFDAANDPDLQIEQPQVQSTFNWNGRNMQLTDVSDKNELLAQEIDAEGEPVGRPEPISMEDYRKVVEQQVAAPEATPEVRSYDVAGKQISFIPQGDGTYMGDPMETPEEAQTALEEMTKQIGSENVVEIKTTPGVDNLTPATYQLQIRPRTEMDAPGNTLSPLDQLMADAEEAPAKEASSLDKLIPEGEAKQYTLNDQPIERGKALARVKAAIFANDRKKIEGLDVTGDEELTKMLEKAFPVKITIGKKKATTEDALNWIDAADTLEELRKLQIEGAAPTNDVKNAYALKVKELVPEVSPEESDKLFSELFAPEIVEPEITEPIPTEKGVIQDTEKVTEPINTQQNDNRNVTGIPGSEQVGETIERARSVETGSGAQAPASGDVQSDGQGLQEKREGKPVGGAKVRTEDQGTPAPVKAEGLKVGDKVDFTFADGGEYSGAIQSIEGAKIKVKSDEGRNFTVKADRVTLSSDNAPSFKKKTGKVLEEANLVALHNINEEDISRAVQERKGQLITPSLAIVQKGVPFTDFGSITLIGDKGLIDPQESSVKVFKGDVYSPTVPRPQYEVDKRAYNKWSSSIMNKAYGAGFREVSGKIANTVEDFGVFRKELVRDSAEGVKAKSREDMRIVYLLDKGIDFKIPMKPKPFYITNNYEIALTPEEKVRAKEFLTNFRIQTEASSLDLTDETRDGGYNLVREVVYNDTLKKYANLGSGEAEAFARERADKAVERTNLNFLADRIGALVYGKTELDGDVYKEAIDKKFKSKELSKDFDAWLDEKINQFQGRKYFEKGKEKLSYTTENLVEATTGATRAQEKGLTYGMNKAKASAIKQLRNLGEIREAQKDLVSKEEMSAIEKELQERYFEVANKIKYKWRDSFGKYDDFGKSLADYFKGASPGNALLKNDYVPTQYDVDDFKEFADELRNSPIDYLEAKTQRAVGLNEFRYAVVPESTNKETITVLKEQGLKVKKYKDNDERVQVVKEIAEKDKSVSFKRKSTAENTINVDGVDRPTLNSKGQPIHSTEEGIRNFWKWFGDSRVVDEQGRPKIMYHGTARVFDEFLKAKAKDTEGRKMQVGWGKDKFYFADSGEIASIAASGAEFFGKGKLQNVMPVYLKMVGPIDADAYEAEVTTKMGSGISRDASVASTDKELRKQGVDGIESWTGGSAVFDPTQVKSATGNLGTFNPTDPRISYKKKPFSLLSMVDKAAAQTDTNPSEAQIEAGNYQKGHVNIQGMEVSIENPKGSVRRGTDEDGKAWETKMKSHYGYFKGTVGKDGDHVDTFIGPNPENSTIFVVDQNNPKTGEFDESKVMLGYNTLEEAKAAYLANYQPGWEGLRDITSVGVEPFKKWLYDGARQRKPFGEYVEIASPIRFQAKKLYAGLETVPKFKDLTELTTWLQKWGKKNKVFASEEAKLDDDKFVKGLVKHTLEELAAFEELSDYPYLGFYDYDIPTRLNPELQKFAEKRYGYELSPSQVALYHLVSGFASPSADPVMDSSKGLDVFDRYMRTSELTSASDKPATVWSMNEMGKKVDTGVPKLDAEGKPIYSQVTMAYATQSLNKFRDNVLKNFNGDIDKAIDWISTRHSYEEISKMMGAPVKGKGSLDVHEYLTKEDGGFGIFGFTGAKLGSYVLNRIGNFSTVTKDLWYARTMARLTGEALQEKTGEALKLPWAITAEGRRKRALADKAWGIVADKLGITPADVQQKMWEFEKRLYEKIGAKGSSGTTGYASEGFMKRAKELEPSLYEPFKPAKPAYKKKAISVSGANSDLKSSVERWESEAKFQTSITLATEVETADLLHGKVTPEFEKAVRETGFYGLYANNEIFMDPTMDPAMALTTWAHEKTHLSIASGFSSQKSLDKYLEGIYDYIGVSEFRSVVPVEYWFEDKATKADEYLAHMAEDYILGEGKIESAPEMVQELVKEIVESFTTVKYLQDEKQRLDQQRGRTDVGKTDTGGTQEVAGNRPGEAPTSDGGLRLDESGAEEVDLFEQLFEGVPAYKLKEETVNVDGVDRPVLNSKGLPIHATTEGVKNFWKWFGDSKVVDKEGRPLVVYHGTDAEFKEFDPATADAKLYPGGSQGAVFFTDNADVASSYAGRRASMTGLSATFREGGNVLPVYLKMINPKKVNAKNANWDDIVIRGDFYTTPELVDIAKSEDRDGLILSRIIDFRDSGIIGDMTSKPSTVFTAFSSTQIKSATGNLGGFDPTDPRITFKRKPLAQVDKKQVQTTGERIQEILVNNKLALKNWMEDIQTIVPTIQDYENPLLKDALAKSKVTTKLHNFEGKQYKRLIASVADVLKTSKISKEELSHYLIAVHGVERNERFWNNEPLRIGEDFSGLSELKKTVRGAADPAEQLKIDGMNNEAFADYYAKQIEGKLSPRQVKELWDSIRDISKATLDELLDAGMISKAYYDDLRVMYKNYIPLRAWEDSNPEEFEFGQGVGSYNAPIIQAKGRKSLAEDPLATILQMANTAYISGERNRVKVAAGELVRNNDKALKDFVQYKRTYFVKQGADAQGNPIIQETIDRPDQALFDQGLVTTKVPREYTARKTSAQAKEFEVEFFRNGNKYVLVFQGSDPAVARAINNKEASLGLDYLNKVVASPVKIGNVEIPSIASMSRYLSAINTTYSIDFPIVNFVRDAPMAILSEYVYGDAKDALRMFPFMKDAEGAMRRKLQGKQDLTNPIDQQLEDFFNFGGPTGFAFLKNVEEFKASVKRDVRRINDIKNPMVRMESGFVHGLKLISQLSEWSETITRFAGYLNHIQQGDTKEKAALAAKNLTVNFDQKGRLSPTLNGLYTFFNAAIQAVDKYFKLWGRNWKKMAAVHMFLTVQGFMNAILLDLFGGEDEDKVKNYDKVSDYTKKNNLVIPIPGTNETFSFPVPQILRKFHAMGFDAYDLMTGKKSAQEVLLGQLSSIPSDISPIDTESFLNGEGDLSIKPLVPSILKPIVELEANENFMKMPISPEPFSLDMARKIADTRKVYKDVNQIAQFVTDKLYELGGGDETGFKYVYDDGELKTIPALLDISPESIEHLFESYFGGVGKLANRTGKTTSDVYSFGKKLVEGEDFKEAIKEINVNVIPIANRFIRTPLGDPLQKEFRKVRNDFENKLKVLKQAEKDKDFEKFNTIYMQIGGKLEQYKAIMTTFEKLDEERLKLEKVSPEDSKEITNVAREQMQEIIKLK